MNITLGADHSTSFSSSSYDASPNLSELIISVAINYTNITKHKTTLTNAPVKIQGT
jgi:hypothetical protein